MSGMIGRVVSILSTASVLCLAAGAQTPQYDLKKDVVLEQRLNQDIPLDIRFMDEGGRDVDLQRYFDGKPVALMLPFYQCAGICTAELNGLVKALKKMTVMPGKDFRIVLASINPYEKPQLAAMKKQAYLGQLGRPEAGDGWHFLTGKQESITRLTEAVGYHYVYDKETDQYIHPPGLIILTPKGRISRVFGGVDYNPRDLRLALIEASEGKIGTRTEQVLLACYQFDPQKGRYGLAVARLLQISGGVTLALLVGYIAMNLMRERLRRQHAASGLRDAAVGAAGSGPGAEA
ncbi:MAG: SCO family protein [Chthonomonadales bacterium]|nr:SCO family protein [Chthonomonadales bacterium]